MLEDKIFTFNKYMKQKFGKRVVRISLNTGFECPWNRCVFCRKESFSPNVSVDMSKENWREILNTSMTFLKKRYKNEFFAAYFQSGTSTFGDKKILKKYYREASEIDGTVALIISTRPDFLGEAEIDTILDSVSPNIKEIWVELGLQSTKSSSLIWANRGHSARDYFQAIENIEKFAGNRIKAAPHIILGIPGESDEEMIKSVLESVSSNIVKGLKLHHLQIHNGAPLEKIYARNPFPLLTMEKYIELMGKIIPVVPREKVFFRLFTTAPKEYLVAPIWRCGTKQALEELEKYLDANAIFQGCKAK